VPGGGGGGGGGGAGPPRQVVRWRRVIEEMIGDGKRVAVLGAERIVAAFLSRLQIDGDRIEQTIEPARPPDVVIALGSMAADVKRELSRLDFRPLVLTP
jgi:hypothetical protein